MVAIQQPQSSDTLNAPDHAKLHRVLGIDNSASDESVVIDSADNVGIGTTDPNTALDVDGKITSRDMYLSGATYKTINSWLNNTQSAGVISGGGFTDNADGTMTIAAGTGFIKTSDSVIGVTKFFDWSENASVTPTDNDLSFVYVESDGTISTKTIYDNIDHHTEVMLGRVYREGTDLHFLESAHSVYDLMHRVRSRFYQTDRTGERSDGMATTQKAGGSDNLCLDITAGEFFWGLDFFTTPAFDSSGADTFSTWYNDGSWQETTGVSEIDNQQYNDYGTGLANLGNNKYGVHWVFMHEDGGIHVVYGTVNNTLARVQAAGVPANLPDKVWKMGILIAKIIIEEDETGSFTEVLYPWATTFAGSVVTDHGSLGGLGDDDHPQYIKDNEFTQDSGVLVGTGAGTFAEETGATLRTSLGLAIGSDVQAYDTNLEKKMFQVRLVASDTDNATGTGIGGDYRISPKRAITITGVGAYVDTAGATGSDKLTVDINEAGTTILSTKITLDVGEKTSETAVTAPVINDSAIATDAIITIDVDTVNETTVSKGLIVWVEYNYA